MIKIQKISKMALIATILLFTGILSCTDSSALPYRLKAFKALMDETGDNNIVEDFRAGKLAVVTEVIESKMANDQAFEKKVKELKADEGISFFNVEQLVSFYYNSFYLKISQ